jgi:phosphoserine phosphatase RsbU/P
MKMLIAEDDRTTRLMLEGMLRKWGLEVEAAGDGQTALAMLTAPAAPRLALLDWTMPGLDGIEVLQRLRQSIAGGRAYVILLTGRDRREDVVAGLNAGANDYIVKPFDPSELEARVRVGARVVGLQDELANRVVELEAALSHIKTLQGILPICMYCHKIRTDDASWERLEGYIQEHSDAHFSHSLCPECLEQHYPDPDEKRSAQ